MRSRSIVRLGIASAALYALVYFLQRAMWPLSPAGHLGRILVAYVITTVALFAVYAALLRLLYREAAGDREATGSGARRLVIAFPIVIAIALALGRPYQSIDVWTYVAQGQQVVDGRNPYLEPVKALAGTAEGAALAAEGWIPVHDVSPYGPLWTSVEALAVRATPNIGAAGRLLKLIAGAFGVGCAWLIWLILGRVSPSMQLLGTAAYSWNPVVIVEFAAEGHNDGLMIFCVLLSIYLWIVRRPIAGIAALATGVAVKIVSGIVAPLELVYAWRTSGRRQSELFHQAAIGAVATILIVSAAYSPYWAGFATVDGIRAHGRPGMMAGSTSTVLFRYLTQRHSENASAAVVSVSMGALLVAFLVIAGSKIRDADSLLHVCGATALAYLVAAPGYWPWYAALPIALSALSPNAASLGAIAAVSIASRLAAPIDALRLNGLLDWPQELFAITIVGVWLPIAAILTAGAWRTWAERRTQRVFVPRCFVSS